MLNVCWTSVEHHLSLTHRRQFSKLSWNRFLIDQRGDMALFLQPGARLCEGYVPLYSFQIEVLSFPGIEGPSVNHCYTF